MKEIDPRYAAVEPVATRPCLTPGPDRGPLPLLPEPGPSPAGRGANRAAASGADPEPDPGAPSLHRKPGKSVLLYFR